MERKGSMLFGNNGSISLSKVGFAELRQERGGRGGRENEEIIKHRRRQKRTEGERMGVSVTGDNGRGKKARSGN